MSAFRVGQRVRVILPTIIREGRVYLPRHPAAHLGCEATVRGTPSLPNAGFDPEIGDHSIQPDGYPGVGMVSACQLVPLYDGGFPAESESIEVEEPCLT